MPVKRIKWISQDLMRAHPEWWFVFGDNEARVGRGGQAAVMRYEPNSIGVVTKRKPERDADAYWSDADAEAHIAAFDADFDQVVERLRAGEVVVIPFDGIGTGMSELPVRAPRVYAHIQARIADVERRFGVD
jgi:hypothetical protein